MQLNRATFFVVLLLCSARTVVYSQCSIVSLESTVSIEAGTPVVVTANLSSNIPPSSPTFKWNISIGTISSGEGTQTIAIDTAGLAGRTLKVSVEVTGIATPCSTTATRTVNVTEDRIICDLNFDMYGDIKWDDELARIDNFAIALQNSPDSTAQIIAYAGRQTYRNEASERLARVKNYLVRIRGIQPDRITTVDGGHIEEFRLQFWVVPPGASRPTPDTSMQIPRSQVIFTKPRPGKHAMVKHRK